MKDAVWFAVLSALLHLEVQAIPFQVALRGKAGLDPYPGKPRLTFGSDGVFKLTVFSDLHFGENPWDWWGPEQDRNSTRVMRRILKDEKPDYVVINGDLITGENTFKENSTTLIDQIVLPLNEAKIPFSTTHGNHDNQVNITHVDEILREQKVAPLSYTRMAPPGVGGVGGPGNYWVPIYESARDTSPALILWFFDSRGGTDTKKEAIPDWVDSTVVDWIKSETDVMKAVWGPSNKRGALAFVHIPPHIAQNIQTHLDNSTHPGLNDDELGQGSSQASGDPATLGNDAPFWNALNNNIKNLHAVVSGHDHGNEWCARDTKKDIVFCFNKHSGYGGYDSPTWGHGVRNFVFKSANPHDDIKTWIRLEEGETRAEITLNKKYV